MAKKKKKGKTDKKSENKFYEIALYCEEKEDCKEKSCKIDKKDVEKIYTFEELNKYNREKYNRLKKVLNEENGNIKACDCIIFCKNGKILVVEILCGKLTSKELKDKIKQINNCVMLLNHLRISLNYKIIAIEKMDSLQKKALAPQFTNLLKNNIKVCYTSLIKSNICSNNFNDCKV